MKKEKTMKRFWTALLALVTAFCLCFGPAACGGKNDKGDSGSDGGNTSEEEDTTPETPEEEGDTTPETPEEGGKEDDKGEGDVNFTMPEGGFDTETPVTIRFYHNFSRSLQDILDRYIEQFEALYPNITVEHFSQGGLQDKIVSEIQGGTRPDLAVCYPEHVAVYHSMGAVQPLDDFLSDGSYRDLKVKQADGTEVSLNMTAQEQANFIEAFWNEGKQFGGEGQMYMLPYARAADVLYYNKTFFDDNGLSVPATWEDMETVSARIMELTAEVPGKVAFGYDNEAYWFIDMCEQSGVPCLSAEGEKYLFDRAEAHAIAARLKGWYDKGYFTTKGILGGRYTSSLVMEEQCYMSIGSCTGADSYTPARGGKPFEIGVAPIPQTDPAHPKNYAMGSSLCLFKGKDPQRTIASWLFMKYLATNAEFQAELASKNGYVPALKKSVMETNATYNSFIGSANGRTNVLALAVSVAQAQEATYFAPPAFPDGYFVRDTIAAMMNKVFLGTGTIEEAFREAVETCKRGASPSV